MFGEVDRKQMVAQTREAMGRLYNACVRLLLRRSNGESGGDESEPEGQIAIHREPRFMCVLHRHLVRG